MRDDFYKFPSTPHLSALGEADIRQDKVMSDNERNDFLKHELLIEEKVDGANLGISFDVSGNVRFQNRGSYLQSPFTGQWKKLSAWSDPLLNSLFDILETRFILFGEWCYAKHTMFYDKLPDWFLAFDVYDREEKAFFSVSERNSLLDGLGISVVPEIARGIYTLAELLQLGSVSQLSDAPAEGLYLRYERDNRLIQRAKLVRSYFIQADEDHWSRAPVTPNKILK